MMNEEKICRLTDEYRSAFTPEHWEDEKYKWQAVKCFQDNWKTNGSDFLQMFNKATSEHYNLLASGSFWQPRAMMEYFCNVCGEAKISEQFEKLFDETIDLRQRVITFMDFFKSDDVIGKVNAAEHKNWKSNQDTRAVSVYLASKYPDKYYFYMENLYFELKEMFGFKQPKGFSDVDKLIKYFEFCDRLCEFITNDHKLTEIFGKYLSPREYQDKEFHILTQDAVFYLKNNSCEIFEDNPTYVSEIIAALKFLGGIASLKEINACIEKRNILPYIKTNPNWKRAVSATLQRFCSETKSYIEGNDELFYSVEGIRKGIWGLVGFDPEAEEDIQVKVDELSTDFYTKDDFLTEVYISEKEYTTLLSLLTHKKNIILQGAPGVGKTFAAKRLAYAFMGEKNESRIKTVQFHQSCSYEDFVEGYRPAEDGGFTLNEGVFKKFCKEAERDSEHSYFFIIDEINRGNLSKIFGELLMLIEADKRGEVYSAELVYSGEKFSVPENLYIIGMMNTADRSLAMIDYALRRRFAFYTMKPAFENTVFKNRYANVDCELFHKAVRAVCELNKTILEDKTLGKGFEIGHSYFCNDPEKIDDVTVKNIIRYELIPTIEEYWFDNENKLNEERAKLETLMNYGEENEIV